MLVFHARQASVSATYSEVVTSPHPLKYICTTKQ